MSSSATTLERAFGMAAGSGFSRPVETSVTNQGFRLRQFRMTEELVLEIELKGAEPEWLVRWMARWSRLLNLPQDWDSYGAERIKVNAVMGAMNLLLSQIQNLTAPPDIIPHRSGGVQLEWHLGGSDLEVLVLSDQQYRISYTKDGAEPVEDLFTSDPQVAADALKEIAISS